MKKAPVPLKYAMLTIVVILSLYVLFSGLIYFICRKKTVPLSWQQCALFLGIKIVAGSAYGYIYGRYYHGDDTWGLNHDAWLQYQRLLHTPALFFKDLFSAHPTPGMGLYFQDDLTYMEQLEHALTTKILAPFNCISQGNYYINIVFFSFLSFWGAYFLYKLLTEQLYTPMSANKKRESSPIPAPAHSRTFAPISVSISVFLFLPALFWLSGIRAEGLLLLFTGALLYYFRQWITKPRLVNTFLCLISLAILFILRNSFALSLLPALAAWWLCVRFNTNPLKAFGGIYGGLVILLAISSFLPPPYSLLRPIVQRQQSFLSLHGNTRFNLTPLEYNISSFLLVAPEALVNTLLRPWPWEAKGALQWLVALENIVLWGLIIACLARYGKQLQNVFTHPLAWLLLFVALSNYLFIGYVVPFPGAIVRYRVLPELFLLCLLALAWKKK